jgi:hypothetical protein
MKGRLRTTLMRLPSGVGYRIAGALHLRGRVRPPEVQAPAEAQAPAERETQPNPYMHALAHTEAWNQRDDAEGLPAATAPADRNVQQNGAGPSSDPGPLTVEVERKGRQKRLRVRAAGDIWSDDFREELARDRHFEASLAWREMVILVFIAAVLAARTIFG